MDGDVSCHAANDVEADAADLHKASRAASRCTLIEYPLQLFPGQTQGDDIVRVGQGIVDVLHRQWTSKKSVEYGQCRNDGNVGVGLLADDVAHQVA